MWEEWISTINMPTICTGNGVVCNLLILIYSSKCMTYDDIFRGVCELAQFAILIPLYLGIKEFKKSNLIFRLMTISLFALALIGFSGYWLYLKGENNVALSHIYTLTEGLLWGIVYYNILRKPIYRTGLLILSCLVITVFWITTGALELLHEINTLNRLAVNLMLLYCSVIGSTYLLERNSLQVTKREDLLLLNAGLFIYSLNNCIFALVFAWLLNNPTAPMLMLWALYSTFVIAYYIIISIAIWKHKKVLISC